MADNKLSVGFEVKDEKVREEVREIIGSDQGFSVRNNGNSRNCDILFFEIGEDFRSEFKTVSALLHSDSVKEIFLVSSNMEPEVLLHAMRSGAREFFPLPLKKEEVVNALTRFKERHKEQVQKGNKKGKIINVVGSKGGIGTTTIAVNLAASLLELHDPRTSVALIDMNLLFGEIPLFLDIEPAFNWGEVAKNISRLDSTYLMSILSRHSSGIYVLPSPSRLDGVNPATPEIIEKLLRLMQKEFDYIVIDGGQSLDEISMKMLELSDAVLINSILSLPCLINVKRLLDTIKTLGYPADKNVRVVINRYHKNSMISLQEAEKGIDKRTFWLIPNDFQTTASAINQGKTLADVSRKADITQSIRELASKFAQRQDSSNEKKKLIGWPLVEPRLDTAS